MSDARRNRWSGFMVRAAAFVFAVALLTYFGSYYYVSRRGMHEAQAQGAEGFLYVPWQEVAATHDLSCHHRLAEFYAPANFADRILFKSDGPIRGILWRLE